MENVYSNKENHLAKPNLIAYNTCLHGYAQRGMIDEAEALIENLESLALNDYELSPDVFTYSICMNAYEKHSRIRRGAPVDERAEKLLAKMIEKYEQTGDRRFMPNQFTFGTGKYKNLFLAFWIRFDSVKLGSQNFSLLAQF